MAAEVLSGTTMDRMTRSLLLLSASLLLAEGTLVWLLPLPLLDPDEPLFACVARRMLESGDYVTPVFKDEPFYDRPVLFYWLLALSVHWLGDNDFAYRLPNLLLGAGTIVFTTLIARRLFGDLAAACTTFIATTLVGGAILRLSIGHDGALVFFATAAVYFGLEWLRAIQAERLPDEWLFASFTGVAAGLAILSKGLLGLGLPAIGILALGLSMRLRPRMMSMNYLVAVTVLIGSSWYLLMHLAHPDFLRYYIWERHVLGFFTSSQRHGGRSVWVYLPAILIGGSPWLFLRWPRWSTPLPSPATKGVLAWCLVTVLPFLIAGSRNPTYLLPAVPPLAIWLGEALRNWLVREEPSRLDPILGKLPMLSLVGVFVGIAAAGIVFGRWPAIVFAVVGLAIMACGYAISQRAFHRSEATSPKWNMLLHQSFVSLVATSAAVLFVLPEISEERSAKSTVVAIRKAVGPGAEVLWFNHLPPSALYHGKGMHLTRVYFDEIPRERATPFVFVTRESRLVEVGDLPLLKKSRHIDLGGKYHVFVYKPVEATVTSGRPDTLPSPAAN